MEMNESWTVWGSARKSLHEGSEQEVKLYVEEQRHPRDDLYIQSPEGREYILEGGNWVEV